MFWGSIFMEKLNAHTPNKSGKWDTLIDHSIQVAQAAEKHAAFFGESDTAYIIGLLHDIGKANPDFQQYLDAMYNNQFHEKVPHAKWGAVLTYWLIYCKKNIQGWERFALPIAGHHSGLSARGILSAKLQDALNNTKSVFFSFFQDFLKEIQNHLKRPLNISNEQDPFCNELRIRMIFSALVDADYLETENHFDSEKSDLRIEWPTIQNLWEKFKIQQDKFIFNKR